MSVDDSSGSFKASRPRVVLDGLSTALLTFDYDVFDADRFLVVESAGDHSAPAGVTMVVNWLDELERRVKN